MSAPTNHVAALLVAATLLGAAPVVAQRPAAVEKPRPTVREEGVRPGRAAASTPATAPALPASAHYRVTMTGFRVNRESWDTFLETDGKGDEIAISAEVLSLGADG